MIEAPNPPGAATKFYSVLYDSVSIKVKARPGARQDAVLGTHAGELVVSVRAAPEKGRANAEIVRVLADTLGVQRASVVLKRGGASAHKVFRVPRAAVAALEKLVKGA